MLSQNQPLIRIGLVNYANSLPYAYGLKNSPFLTHSTLEIHEDYPAICADKLLNGITDIALVPAVMLNEQSHWTQAVPFGIAADGKVLSVLIVSQKPIQACKQLLLDYQSRTSVKLAQVLIKFYWKLEIAVKPADENYLSTLNQDDAAVVIGDRAFAAAKQFNYVIDLAEAWKTFTGLPFVFAVWAANKTLMPEFLLAFTQSLEWGLAHKQQSIATFHGQHAHFPLQEYLHEYIKYKLDANKQKGLLKFLELASNV